MAGVVPVFGVTESHVKPGGFVAAVAVKFSGVKPSVLTSETDVVIDAVEPTTATALIEDGLTLINGVVLTFMVTGIESGEFVAPTPVNVIVPVHVCGVVRPVVFAPTMNCVGWPLWIDVTPDVGVTLKKPVQLVYVLAMLNPRGGPVLVRLRT